MKKSLAIAGIVTALILGMELFFPFLFEGINSRWIDQFFKIRGNLPTQNEIALVTIDEKSINKIGRWPWPRSVIAKLVEKLGESEIQAVGFDITFSEVSPDDATLAASLRKSPQAFLGYFFYLSEEEAKQANLEAQEIRENEESIYPSRLNFTSRQQSSSGKKVFGVQTNVLEISRSVAPDRQGFFNVFPDLDGVIRKLPLVLFYKGEAYPSLSLQLVRSAKGFSPLPLFEDSGALKGLTLGDNFIPLNSIGEFFINYRGEGKTFPHWSAADILEDKIPKEQLKNKIILIGATAVGIYDLRVTPFDTTFPGVEVQANAIDNILKGDFLRRNLLTRSISLGFILFTGLLFGFFLPKFRALHSFIFFLVVMGLLVAGQYFLFASKGFLLDNFSPALNGFLTYGGITLYRYFTEERERRKIRKTFQYYLSPSVIQQLLDNPNQLKLGGERKELTVLFSDIRDFTTKAEKLPPEKVASFLNDYFSVMTEIIFKQEGTVDKFMGDAIMAFYGAPIFHADHALRAANTALEMLEQLEKNKGKWCKKYGLDDFRIGIGIHTGVMAVGNMGSERRFNYTVIGDAVNLASRLENLTKDYKVPIIISDANYQAVKYNCEARELGQVQVKGKEEKTIIYELVGKKK